MKRVIGNDVTRNGVTGFFFFFFSSFNLLLLALFVCFPFLLFDFEVKKKSLTLFVFGGDFPAF